MKPPFQSIVDKQSIADYRLHQDKTTRSDPELANYRRVLDPVPLSDVGLPRLPLVTNAADERFVLMGEVAQLQGTVLLFEVATGTLKFAKVADLWLVPAGSGVSII